MTYSYRVEVTNNIILKSILEISLLNRYVILQKPRESRASIFSGALRVPKNNARQNSRSTLIGKDVCILVV